MRGSSPVFVVRASLVMVHPHALMCLFWLSSTAPLSSLCVNTTPSHVEFTRTRMHVWLEFESALIPCHPIFMSHAHCVSL